MKRLLISDMRVVVIMSVIMLLVLILFLVMVGIYHWETGLFLRTPFTEG